MFNYMVQHATNWAGGNNHSGVKCQARVRHERSTEVTATVCRSRRQPPERVYKWEEGCVREDVCVCVGGRGCMLGLRGELEFRIVCRGVNLAKLRAWVSVWVSKWVSEWWNEQASECVNDTWKAFLKKKIEDLVTKLGAWEFETVCRRVNLT